MKALVVAAKSLRIFLRDRPALFWTFAFPLLLITVFSLAFSGQESVRIKVLVVKQDGSSIADAYVSALGEVLDLEMCTDVREAETAVRDGKVTAAVVVPIGFGSNLENARLIYDEARGELATTVVRIVEGVTQRFFDLRLPLTIEGVRGGYRRWNPVQHYVPGMGIMMVLMIGGMGVSTRIVIERRTGTFRRNLLAPISKASYLGGEILSGFIIGCLQMAAFFGVGIGVFGLEIAGSPLLVAVISILVISMSVGFGLVVSTFAGSPDAANGAVQAFVFPASALGGLWFPVEIMPKFMQSVSKLFPTYHAMNAFQDVIVRGKCLLEILRSLAVVAGFAVGFLLLGLIFFKWEA
jgi:ABC-2 type transport system permease protein